MSGTRQIEFTLSGQSTDWTNPDAARIYIERIVEPVLKKARNTLNQLVGDVLSATGDTLVAAKYGIVLADAAAGAQALTLPPPSESHRAYFIAKVDASGNSVTIQAKGGALISGAATLVLGTQWSGALLFSDDTQYVVLALAGAAADVTIGPFDLSTDQDNYSPVGWSGARRVLLNVTSTCNINGFDAVASVQLKTIYHVGTNEVPLGLMEQKLSSSAANRIMTPSPNDVYMLKNWSQDIWYDTSVSRWRVT